jgi:hypothetical protein
MRLTPGNGLTLLIESAQALTSTPTVSITTLVTCNFEYLFPLTTPASIVVTLPKLRRMMCTGTEMLNANAQLFNMLIL